jgi:hypothetical protein
MRIGHVTIAYADRLPELVRVSKGSMDADTATKAIAAILRPAV